MYRIITLCDNCHTELERFEESYSKTLVNQDVKHLGGYASFGIHLCKKCNTPDIIAKYKHRKKDFRM